MGYCSAAKLSSEARSLFFAEIASLRGFQNVRGRGFWAPTLVSIDREKSYLPLKFTSTPAHICIVHNLNANINVFTAAILAAQSEGQMCYAL